MKQDTANRTKGLIPILSVTGSDGTGGSGIQADIKTCGVLGGYALSVVTALTVQDTRGILSTHPMPTKLIDSQLESITRDMPPHAVKIGMMCDAETVNTISQHIRKLNNVVLDTAFISSRGERIASSEVIDSVRRSIMPYCEIVIMKVSEAEILIGSKIANKEDIIAAAKSLIDTYDMRAVIIQGMREADGTNSDLFMYVSNMLQSAYEYHHQYYVLPDHTNCNTHGLAGTLSASIATFLAQKNTLADAVEKSYRYLQTLTVYSINSPLGHQSSLIGHTTLANVTANARKGFTPRQQEIYNTFMQLIANNYNKQHEVVFYANSMNITPRYLSQITMPICGKSPKQLIVEAIIDNATKLLETTTYSIQEIAFRVGYSSQAQFARLFKQIKGMSPSDYRYI